MTQPAGAGARFVNIGERTNVTGSARFKKLILAGDYDAAVEVARQQVEAGAQIIDVNMDEALLDGEAAMAHLPQADRRRARHRAGPGDDRQLQMERDRGGAEMRVGQADRQFDQPEGRRGSRSWSHADWCRAYGAAVVVMAFDETGQADTRERKVEICKRAYNLLDRRRVSGPRTSSSTPTSSRSRPGSTSIAATRSTSSRRRAKSAPLPARPYLGRAVQPQLLVPRQRAGAPRDAQRVPVSRHPGGDGHGASSTPASSTSTTRSTPSCAKRARTSSSTAARTATERLIALAERFRGTDAAAEKAAAEWRSLPVRERLGLCAGQGHRRPHRRRYRGSAPVRRRARST